MKKTIEKINFIKANKEVKTVKEMAAELGVTEQTIRNWAKEYGITLPQAKQILEARGEEKPARKKTEAQKKRDEYIKAHYDKDMSAQKIADFLGVHRDTIYRDAKSLGLTKSKVRKNEKKVNSVCERIIIRLWNKFSITKIAKLLKVHANTVRNHAKTLGLRSKGTKHFVWTAAKNLELAVLAGKNYTVYGASVVMKITMTQVRRQARKLGITFRTHCLKAREKNFIRRYFGHIPVSAIAKAIGFTVSAVYYWIKELGLKAEADHLQLTNGEEKDLNAVVNKVRKIRKQGKKNPPKIMQKQYGFVVNSVNMRKDLLYAECFRNIMEAQRVGTIRLFDRYIQLKEMDLHSFLPNLDELKNTKVVSIYHPRDCK